MSGRIEMQQGVQQRRNLKEAAMNGAVGNGVFARCVSVFLSYLLVLTGAGPLGLAQEATAIEIQVESGDNRVNEDVGTWEIAVQIQDNRGRKLKGAAVVFQLPPGAGTFPGGASMLTVVTDDSGRAVARGFQRGRRKGAFLIVITASYGGLSATKLVTQTNPELAFFSTPKKWYVIGGAAAAVAAGLALGLRGGGSSTTIGLGPGRVTTR